MQKKRKINVHIIGAGGIGIALAGQLSQDNCSVTVVDTDAAVVTAISNTLDVFCYRGNGASYATLREVGAGDADIFIAVTDSDELNILACLTAHLLGARHTVARVRDIDYARHANFYRNQLGLSMTINPELAAAREISRVLRCQPFLRQIPGGNRPAGLQSSDLRRGPRCRCPYPEGAFCAGARRCALSERRRRRFPKGLPGNEPAGQADPYGADRRRRANFLLSGGAPAARRNPCDGCGKKPHGLGGLLPLRTGVFRHERRRHRLFRLHVGFRYPSYRRLHCTDRQR